MVNEKVYIGEVEAFEIAQERGIEELPCNGREILTVYGVAERKQTEVLGKDEGGFYTGIFED